MNEQDLPNWPGITQAASFNNPNYVAVRHALADAAHNQDWQEVFALLSRDKDMVNTSRPGGTSGFTPLHQAAYDGASVEVAQRLIALGAWRTLQNAAGERPVDVAQGRGHRHLLEILAPIYCHIVPSDVLLTIQSYFHQVIHGRVRGIIEDHKLRLPELEPLLELDAPQMWFHVPDMHGGFLYWLEGEGAETKLISESWSRGVR